jgi:hypothetical protein
MTLRAWMPQWTIALFAIGIGIGIGVAVAIAFGVCGKA